MSRRSETAAARNLRDGRGGVVIFDDSTGLDNMRQLIQLRWIAVVGQIVTIAVVQFGFHIKLPLERMALVVAFLIVFNTASLVRWRVNREITEANLFVALLIDVGTLTAQLYFSGGATNPFIFLFLLQIMLAAVLLRAPSLWAMIGITSACFAGLTTYYQPVEIPLVRGSGLFSPYIDGILTCFALDASLAAIFITRISHNLRARDARLADLRERAAEEEHIVRMGLLASGAAHELGSPLSTMSVILGDWRHMEPFTADPELLQEVEEMQMQVKHCKAIVSHILRSAGESRGESPVHTTLRTFLDELVAEWRSTRPVSEITYENRIGEDVHIVSDSAIKQMICNVLDNALEASPSWVGLRATRDDESLTLIVTDAGPGFAPQMLERFGKPYQSSKGRSGGGLGLFLAANVARKLHGSVAARNRAEGGAMVTLILPMAAITAEEFEAHGS
jgi:two-component system sensor histidine kinase RegB